MDYMESKNSIGEFASFVGYLKKAKKFPLLTAEQEIRLARKIKKGDLRAREKMINSNLFLVVSLARQYYKPFYCLGILDLIQEGNIGLIASVEKYDGKRGCKFSTFATLLIRQTITLAIKDKSRIIRIPRDNKIQKYFKKQKELSIELGREPTHEETSKKMGISIKDILEIKNQEIILPLEYVTGHDGFMVGNHAMEKSISEKVTTFLFQEEIKKLINTLLDDREMAIIRLRFGFNGDEPKSLEKIGVIFGITRERVRQILEKIMDKLRNGIREQQPVLEKQS